jgi:hypothetical protein
MVGQRLPILLLRMDDGGLVQRSDWVGVGPKFVLGTGWPVPFVE